jgi:helicase required for RNAi-mediated heterochromatin assembly 1
LGSFPLSEHICALDPAIEAPEYVKLNPIVNISPALSDGKRCNEVDTLTAWPEASPTDFDPSQWAALHHLLTKSLAIVQGPPGTGKTYVAVGALKILLSGMKVGDPPIVIAAQTNHALDQLLSRIAEFEGHYIRLGGRSTDPEIKKHTLFEIRQRERIGDLAGSLLHPAKKERQKIVDRALTLLRPFSAGNSDSPLPASLFLRYKLLTQAQYSSLQKGAEGWIRPDSQPDEDPMVTWLGDSLRRFEATYGEENFDDENEEEIDLDYRQSTELNAEQAFEDDDFENLNGQYLPLKECFIGRSGPKTSDQAAREIFLKLDDLWKVPAKCRGTVYNILRKQVKEKIIAEFRMLLGVYDETCLRLQVGKWESSYIYLQNAKVIGVTTTGLSKYRALISCLKPKIIVIEEAAEVIEAPIAAACVESLQHLILVGDHKQLQGRCSVPELEGDPFYLNVSMFERLVHNGIKFKSLNVQRRMAPEISDLLTPIYGNLQNHPSVQRYAKVPGMGDLRSFFFCHRWLEESDDTLSKFNENEAQMIVRFFLYLVLNGIPVSDITVLTFYNGQRKKLLRLLSKIQYLQAQAFKVVTVDSYQGEENEVIILSLVRSSKNIGFLSDEHRICVALSRAKRGFYIFGNGQALALADPLWWLITKIMKMGSQQQQQVGFKLPLTCKKHGNKTYIQGRQTHLTDLSGSNLTN